MVVLKLSYEILSTPVRVTARTVDFCTSLLESPNWKENEIAFCQLRCAQDKITVSYLDVPVMEKAVKQRLMSTFFPALSRRTKEDTFSRVRVHQPAWKVARYNE